MCMCSVENEYTCYECEKLNARVKGKQIAQENAQWYKAGYDAVCAIEQRIVNGPQTRKANAAQMELRRVREQLWLNFVAWARVSQ